MNGKLFVISWGPAFNLFVSFLVNESLLHIEAFCGYFTDLETVLSLKDFFTGFGCSNINYIDNVNMSYDFRFTYLLNNTLTSLENISYAIFVGTNLRLESPLMSRVYAKVLLIIILSFILLVYL